MNYFFITGSSRGLGLALAKKILENDNAKVMGVSRKNSISHPNYRHFSIDLSDIETLEERVEDLFIDLPDAEKITLVNNAGVLGDIAHVGKLKNKSLKEVFNVNFIAPALLTNEFIRKYHPLEGCHKLILNISSGAGKKPTDGWASYCSSKAALDMFSEVVSVEKQKDHNNLKILSVAPGIVDTDMQSEIRESDKENFSRLEEFIEYKKENMLVSPEKVASKLIYIMQHESDFHQPQISVRDI